MRYIKFFVLLLLILLINTYLFSNNYKGRIAVFPFYNYSDSSIEYFTSYIPELLNDKIIKETEYEVVDLKKVNKFFKNSKDVEKIWKTGHVKNILKNLNASYGIFGRYIIQGDVIRINYNIISLNDKIKEKKLLFNGKVDKDLLKTLDDFINEAVLSIKSHESDSIDKKIINIPIFEKILVKIKGSKIGFILKYKWVIALLVIIAFLVLTKLLCVFFEKVLSKVALRTKTEVDDHIINAVKGPFKWILLCFGLRIALISLELSSSIVNVLNNIITAMIIFFIMKTAIRITDILIYYWGSHVTKKISSRINEDLVPLFTKVSKTFIITIGSLVILSNFNIRIGPLIASLGIVGFAIGFAVKDSLANIIGGIVLILDKSFVVGDKVSIDGDIGIVHEVGLRNTKIKTFDNEVIVIPNGELMNKRFKNFVLPDPTIRVVVNFGVAYGTNVDKVEKVVLKAISDIDKVVDDPQPVVVFRKMGDFSLDFQAKFWIPLYGNQYDKKREATKKIYNALNKAKINIPFPTHTVYLENK